MALKHPLHCIFVILGFALLSGCSSPPAMLTIQPEARDAAFEQSFPHIWGVRNDDGTYEFILVADDAQSQGSSDPRAILHPVSRSPLHQVIDIKVLWRPMPGAEARLADNATITWYVLPDAASEAGSLIEYTGTAFVTVHLRDQAAQVAIRRASIKLKELRGALHDPIGQATLSGEFTAVENEARLTQVLVETKARASGAGSPAS